MTLAAAGSKLIDGGSGGPGGSSGLPDPEPPQAANEMHDIASQQTGEHSLIHLRMSSFPKDYSDIRLTANLVRMPEYSGLAAALTA
jgi:hypothetical protein